MKPTLSERWFYKINYTLLALIGITCLLPFLHIFALSFSSAHAISSGFVSIWPVELSLDSYTALFEGTRIFGALQNSIVITVVGVTCSMAVTILTAYPLSKPYFYARKPLTLAMVFTMMFAGGMIPTYLVVKSFGLVNTYGALWIPALISTYNLLVVRTYFENIPAEMEEAARIDGCGEWTLLMRIILPVSMPVLATITLFYGVSFWNMFMSLLIYINQTEKYNMTVLVQQMIQNQSLMQDVVNSDAQNLDIVPEGIKASGIIVMVFPMLMVYPFLQRFFVKGVMLGSIKG